MERSTIVIGVAVVLLVGAPLAFGMLNGGDSGDSGEDIESFPTATDPTATATSGGGGDGSGTSAGADADTQTATPDPSFGFVVDRIEECGETCRDVTTTLSNDGGPATGVTVYTRIYAGNGTDGDVVWQGTEDVGSLDAGESYTTTKRVELSVSEAFAVQQADGWITVQTAIESDQKTITFTERRNVM